MPKQTSTSQRIRALIERGYPNKLIVEKLNCKPQMVYNIRYQINKARGLGSLPSVPKRKYTRRAGTAPVTGITPAFDAPALQPIKPYVPYPVKPEPYMPITMIETKPSLWQRVKGWFRGANA
jgi:hypothetical protein